MSEHILYLNEENYKDETTQSEMPVVVDFYADWCGPCQLLIPVLDEVAEKYQGKVKVCKVNIDEHRKIALSNKVMGIPTLFFMKNGELMERFSGAMTQAEMEEKLDSML